MKANTIERFALGYAFLALVVIAALFGAYKGLTYQTHIPKTVVHQSDLGYQNLKLQACDYVRQSGQSQNIVVRTCKVLSVNVKGNNAAVKVVVTTSSIPKATLLVNFTKGIWTVATVTQA